MLATSPITQRLRGLLGRGMTKADVCDRIWRLCPTETAVSRSAIFSEGDLARIIGYQEETTPELERVRIRGGRRQHIGTIAYRLRNVTILDGHAYKGPVRLKLAPVRTSLSVSGRPERLAEAVMACTLYGNRFFGHFMTDDLPLAVLAGYMAEPITVARTPYRHEPAYQAMIGISRRPIQYGRCDSLIVLDDFGQNRLKRARYEGIRARLRNGGSSSGARGVYISRGATGTSRVLVNEIAIEQYLSSLGFAIIDPDECSATEFVRRSLGAQVVVGVEGSQLAPALFTMADGGTLLALVPPFRFNNVFKDYTDCLDMRYGFTVGRAAAGGFRVEIDDMAKLLERIAVAA